MIVQFQISKLDLILEASLLHCNFSFLVELPHLDAVLSPETIEKFGVSTLQTMLTRKFDQ